MQTTCQTITTNHKLQPCSQGLLSPILLQGVGGMGDPCNEVAQVPADLQHENVDSEQAW